MTSRIKNEIWAEMYSLIIEKVSSDDELKRIIWKWREILIDSIPTAENRLELPFLIKDELRKLKGEVEKGKDEIFKNAVLALKCSKSISEGDIEELLEKGFGTRVCEETVIGIITIIPEEFNAVIEKYSMVRIPSNKLKKTKRIFYEAHTEKSGKKFHLIMTQAQGQGNQAGLAAYFGLNMNFEFDYIALIGIAGSIDEKAVKIGDVVIARSIFDGQLGKETEAGFKTETNLYTNNAVVNSIIVDFMNEAEGKCFRNKGVEYGKEFSCRYEPVGNNNHLIVDKDSIFVNNLQHNINRKVVAVEMEGAGVA